MARRLYWLQLPLVSGLILLCACSREDSLPLFTLLPPEVTGIDFVNAIQEQEGFNVLEYGTFTTAAA